MLSSFVMSNARGSSRAIFSGQMQDALSALKQAHPHDGKLYDDAAKLVDYVVNLKEEAQFLKTCCSTSTSPGLFGFGLVNLLQPLHMTSAQIALYNGSKAGAAVKTVWKSYGRAVTAIRTGKPPQEYAGAFKPAQREVTLPLPTLTPCRALSAPVGIRAHMVWRHRTPCPRCPYHGNHQPDIHVHRGHGLRQGDG